MLFPGRPGISARELAEWLAFERIEGPLGPERIDYAAAVVAQTIIAMNLKKGKKPPKLSELTIDWDTDKPKGSGLELLHKVIMANRMLGGKDETAAKLPAGEGAGL